MLSNTCYSLLLIEGKEDEFLRFRALLADRPGKEYRLRRVRTVESAETLILESGPHSFDLCLLADDAGDDDNLEFISAHSMDSEFPPMALLTRQTNPDLEQLALDAGAMDCLQTSELSPALVERSIRYCIAQHSAKLELVKLATTDPLTGILNRRTLYDLGDKEFDRATRYGHPLSLVLIGVDHFRDVNDTFGYQVGDKVLNSVVSTVLAAIRETDIFGRFGGSEFLLILPHTDLKGASLLAERLGIDIQGQPVIHDGAVIDISLSCGVCALSDQVEFFDELIVAADRALYRQEPGVS
ncbi:Stalked cell differentiation-controlling protein [Thiorhodovibrio winogradskyi]|uniref:diguanylate cyclase n=1 Tax=Thiorhodovibrio winogradskyi TaxID=77007 RepID=A0ABZ0S5E2_9GAMM|nr:GGDEF domain-containing protein [Thiorhodovibrio winogradskyi]